MKLRKLVSIILSGCFMATTIPSDAWGRKYTEIQLSSDSFIISIKATDTTTHDKAISGLLTRASEVTVRNGYKYFVVTDKQDHSAIHSSSYLNMFGVGSATATHHLSKVPHGQLTIKCYKADPGNKDAIDAEFFLANKK